MRDGKRKRKNKLLQIRWVGNEKKRKKRGIKIYERNNQWSEAGMMKRRKRKKIENL